MRKRHFLQFSYKNDHFAKPGSRWNLTEQQRPFSLGGDTQSTEGTEASHMRSADDGLAEECFNRGYETWLLHEAKRRNPDVATMALSWGVPGWIGNGSTADSPGRNVTLFFTEDNIVYHVRYALGLKKYKNITLDWMGVSSCIYTHLCIYASLHIYSGC